jgi:hypothetical protein
VAESLLVEVSKALPQADLVEVNDAAADLMRRQAGDLIADLSLAKKKTVRRLVAQATEEGWSDATLKRRLASVIGLDTRRAQAVQNFRTGLLKNGTPPGRAERLADQYARRLLKERIRIIAETEMRKGLRDAQRLVWKQMQERADFSPYAVRVTKVQDGCCATCRSENGSRRSLKDIHSGPPFHPNCRCQEEVVDRGVEKSSGNPEGDGSMVPMIEKAITPGGRVGDASSLNVSPKKNWVENAGGLPKYIRMVAHAMMRKGKSRSQAIQLAIGIVRNWASGQGNVSAKVRAAAAKAVAEFEAKRKKGKVSKADETTWNMADYQEIVKQLEADGV